MGIIGSLMSSIRANAIGKKNSWTPDETRALIASGDLSTARRAADHLWIHLTQRSAERACLLGEIAFHERRDEEASSAFREALNTAPGMPSAHYGLSLLLAERGEFDIAVQHAQFASVGEPGEPRYLAQLGYCHVALGNFQIAEQRLRDATRLDPGNAPAWNNLGIVLLAKKNPSEARDCFLRAVTLRPNFISAREHLTSVEELLRKQQSPGSKDGSSPTPISDDGESDAMVTKLRKVEASEGIEAAIEVCEDLVMEHPELGSLAVELHRLYERAGDPQSGIDVLEAYIARQPGSQVAMSTLGLAYARTSNHSEAERHLMDALANEPDRVDLLAALTNVHFSRGRYAEAMPLIERAHELAPTNDAIRGQYAAGLTNACRYEEALAVCEHLRSEGKESACYGSVLAYLGRFEEALDWLGRALVMQPNDPNLRFQRAQIALLSYRFSEGWDDYSFRGMSYSKNFRMLPFPSWQGEPLAGKRIVVLAEQGLGDQVMFASCLGDLLALKPAEVIVEVIQRIAPTIERSFPECRIVATRQDSKMEWAKEFPDMDFFVPLADLPRHFRRSISDFPAHEGYLVPDPVRIQYWKDQLAATGPGPYIGISWRGGTEVTRTSLRSIQASMLAPFSRAIDARFVCLQYGDVKTSLVEAVAAGLPLAHWPEAIADLDEFAALIASLDLVVTVCNTTVHYAGAVGTPVWVMAPHIPEWRYGLAGDAMPWYPSSRMFRQESFGEWDTTIDIVCRELSAWAKSDVDNFTERRDR